MRSTHSHVRSASRPVLTAAIEALETRTLMSVQVNCHGQFINNGDTIATNDNACYEFGFFRQGSTAQPRSITYDIFNDGNNNIAITQITVPTGFKITSGPTSGAVLEGDGGDSNKLTIQLDAASPGQHMGNVVIKSNDGGTFEFEIAGSVGSYAVANGYDLGTIGSAHRSDELTGLKERDGSGSAVVNPGVNLYHFDLLNPHNNLTLKLDKPTGADGVNMRIYRDANDDGILQISEEQEIFPQAHVDPQADSPIYHDTRNGTLTAGSYLIKCFGTEEISDGDTTNPYDFTITATPQPDSQIKVQAAGKSAITDNDLTPSTADATDFGNVTAGAQARRDFVITNTGNAPLLLNPEAFLSNNHGFAIDAGLPSSIAPGQSATLGILMLTNAPGDASAQVVIPTNDPRTPQFNFNIAGHVTAASVVHGTPPLATLLTGLRVRTIGGTFYKFTIRYTDETGVDLDSINSEDITVTGPGGFSSGVRLLSKTPSHGGTQVDAFYRLAARDGTWDRGDNGLYSFNLNDDEVTDLDGNATPGSEIGQFTVRIPKTSNPAAVTVPATFSTKLLNDDSAVWA